MGAAGSAVEIFVDWLQVSAAAAATRSLHRTWRSGALYPLFSKHERSRCQVLSVPNENADDFRVREWITKELDPVRVQTLLHFALSSSSFTAADLLLPRDDACAWSSLRWSDSSAITHTTLVSAPSVSEAQLNLGVSPCQSCTSGCGQALQQASCSHQFAAH